MLAFEAVEHLPDADGRLELRGPLGILRGK